MPLPMKLRTMAGGTGSSPSSASMSAAAAAISGAVSSKVPSRSSRTARIAPGSFTRPQVRRASPRSSLRNPRTENRGPRHEGVRASRRNRSDIVDLHSAIDLDPHLPARGLPGRIDASPDFRDLVEHRRDKFLAAESGVDRHQQYKVDLVQRVVEIIERGRRVEDQPGLASVIADERNGAVDVLRSFRVKADDSGPALAKSGTIRSTGFTMR